MIAKNQSRVLNVGLLLLTLLTSMTIVPIQYAFAGFALRIDPETGKKYTPIKVLPLNIVAVEGTRLADDLAGRNGPFGWLRGWLEVIGIVAEKNDIWMQAGIQFALRHVIRVPDPEPPPPNNRGDPGDIRDPRLDGRHEYNSLIQNVENALKNVSSYRGITEIKIGHFVNNVGEPTDILGWAYHIPVRCNGSMLKEVTLEPRWITIPPFAGRVSGVPIWPPGYVEAHEVGHLLGLYHPWDEVPPRDADPSVPHNHGALPPGVPTDHDELMSYCCLDAYLNPNQIRIARDRANNCTPSVRDRDKHTGAVLPSTRYALSRSVDEIYETAEGFLDLFDVDAWINVDSSDVAFHAFTTGLLPSDISGVSYTYLMNLDNNNATGVTLELNGVDAVADVLVDKVAGVSHVSYNLTLFDLGKNPVLVVDPAVSASVTTLISEDCESHSERASFYTPESILTTFVPIVEGYPVLVKSLWSNTSDSSPILNVSHIIPQRALLNAGPLGGPPGTVVSMNGSYFTPNAPLWLMLNDMKLAETSTDMYGQFSTSITIPTNATEGDYSLWAFSPIEDTNGDLLVYQVSRPSVGGTSFPLAVPIDNFGQFAPYFALASTIVTATVAVSVCVKRAKRRKEKL